MNATNPSQVAAAAAVGGAAAWHAMRPLAQPYLDRALGALPAYLAARARDRFAAAVKSGAVPPRAQRLLKRLERAAVEWANEELAGAGSLTQAAALVDDLAHVPGLGRLLAADPTDAAHDIAVELDAVKLQLQREANGADAPAFPSKPAVVVVPAGAPTP